MKKIIVLLILITLSLLSPEVYAGESKLKAKRPCVSPAAAEKYIALTATAKRKFALQLQLNPTYPQAAILLLWKPALNSSFSEILLI